MKKIICIILIIIGLISPVKAVKQKNYIKWVDFNVTADALSYTAKLDIESRRNEITVSWIELLAIYATQNGGDFKSYSNEKIDKIMKNYPQILNEYSNNKLYKYYFEAYSAVLSGFIGNVYEITEDENGNQTSSSYYGIKAASPIAAGYGYTHYDDFGASRSYGYKRSHLGHDIMGSVGTPIVAVESGYVETCGWNQYGGWRIGIRSFDSKRYYYYAHLRRNHPYNDIYEGKIVHAGEIIGYLGMTGYSVKENVNNIDVPHLHYGMEIIFDKEQKDGYCQIWIDLYEITKFLDSYRCETYYDSENKEHKSKRHLIGTSDPD